MTTLSAAIVRVNRDNPTWTVPEIAAAAGTRPSIVYVVKRRFGLAIPRATVARGRKPQRAGKTTLAAFGHCATRGTVKMAAVVPAELFDAIKAEAIRQNISMGALMRAYCEIGLAQERGNA